MTSRSVNKDKKERFPDVLEKCLGVVDAACKTLKISRPCYYKWRQRDPEFAAKCDETREVTYDIVEGALLKKIREGDTACIIFFCKTKMKHRGYVERIEQTGKDGEALNTVKFTVDDKAIVERAIQRRLEAMNAQKPSTTDVESAAVN